MSRWSLMRRAIRSGRRPGAADEPPANLWTGGRLQELLYLNPEPDTQRIVDKPTRQQIHAAWLAKFRDEKAEVGF